MRRFVFNRVEDKGGVSGVGIVAEGVQFKSGRVVISWLTKHTSIGVYDDIETAVTIHGHGGATKIKWLDRAKRKPRG